ncbi:MAG: kinase/pyrophosphorylase [Betaproteobacteria bacterium]|nr:kinase/pyrophosphorylase [Betaproteobacteria bacterium]
MSNPPVRTVFFVSDGTGITVEMLGHSLLTQFDGIAFEQVTAPFVNTRERAEEWAARIAVLVRDGLRPVVLTTLVDESIRAVFKSTGAFVLDFFEMFLNPLELELGIGSTHTMGRSHSARDRAGYQQRMEAVNFSLAHDDGISTRDLPKADVILVGVSRSGKTPTCLYLALQFGVRAANYPLIPEDFERGEFPPALAPHLGKIFGLTIVPERLSEIRNERRPGSQYADPENCRREVAAAEAMMRGLGIRWVNSTTKSIEEIAATIMEEIRIVRRAF